MKEFKLKLEKDRKIRMIIVGLLLVLFVLVWIRNFPMRSEDSHMTSTIAGTQVGIVGGLLGGLISQILKITKQLKNPEILEAEYTKSKDERNIMISEKASRAALTLIILILGVATLIAGFVDRRIYFTLGAVLIGILLTASLTSVYFSKKY